MNTRLSAFLQRLRSGAYSIPIAIVAAGMMMAISELTYQRERQQLEELLYMGQARLKVLATLQRLTEAESGKRGYLLVHDPSYLAPYERAARDVESGLQDIARLDGLGHDPEVIRKQQVIHELMESKLGEMREVMRLDAEGRHGDAVQVIRSNIGLEVMQNLRKEVNELMDYRNERVADGIHDLTNLFLLNRVGILAMTLTSVIVLIMLIRLGRTLDLEREQQRRQLRQERDALEHEVNARTADLKELTVHLQTVREDERARLARELHDELGALLTTAKLDVAYIRPKVQKQMPELLPKLGHLTSALNDGIALKRRIIEDLSPSSLRTLGLVPALEILCGEARQTCQIDIIHQLQPARLADDEQLTAYRFVQEAITNMIKYSHASRATVRMVDEGEMVRLEVCDNGKGFDTENIQTGSHGLRGMRFRVEATGGQMMLASQSGEGTRITALIPQQAAHVPAVPTDEAA